MADFYIVVYRDARQSLELSCYAPTPTLFIPGGRERQDSVINALAALPDAMDFVFIHDCARPLIRPEQLTALLQAVRRNPAVALAHRVTDTIRQMAADEPSKGRARKNAPAQQRTTTLDRARLWAMETPQVFARDVITRAYARVQRRGLRVTDDVQAVEGLGQPVTLLENPHPNPKLTTPADLAYLEFLLSRPELSTP